MLACFVMPKCVISEGVLEKHHQKCVLVCVCVYLHLTCTCIDRLPILLWREGCRELEGCSVRS